MLLMPPQRVLASKIPCSVACWWQAVSGMEAWDPKEKDDDRVRPFALS
ncbi:hypothetical protein GCM10009751_06770 [Myceligenerans crystallogenes]|uniref:Uncharacterized protein n=1 Tax=Myceligenerans crystallogenes TaxID=316335 RepID=A0ABN2N7W5_9MICO